MNGSTRVGALGTGMADGACRTAKVAVGVGVIGERGGALHFGCGGRCAGNRAMRSCTAVCTAVAWPFACHTQGERLLSLRRPLHGPLLGVTSLYGSQHMANTLYLPPLPFLLYLAIIHA